MYVRNFNLAQYVRRLFCQIILFLLFNADNFRRPRKVGDVNAHTQMFGVKLIRARYILEQCGCTKILLFVCSV